MRRFFAMLAPDSTSPWQSLLLLVGCVAMVLPLFGTVLVLIFAGNIRWISQPAFLDFVLENRVLTSAVAPCIILSGLAFTLFLVLTVGQMATAWWVGHAATGMCCTIVVLLQLVNARQSSKAKAAALVLLKEWPSALQFHLQQDGKKQR